MRRMMRAVARLSDLGGWLAGLAIVLIVLLVFVEVALRNLLGRSTMIADEVSGYLNVAAVFLGLAYTLKEGGFIRVELLYQALAGRAKAAVQWAILAASLAYTVVLLVVMWRYVAYSFGAGIVSTNVLRAPLWMPQSLILAGAALLALQLLAYCATRGRDLP